LRKLRCASETIVACTAAELEQLAFDAFDLALRIVVKL
jgi:hypothetical protein